MWVYSTTRATSAEASVASITNSASTFESVWDQGEDYTASTNFSTWNAHTTSADPYQTTLGDAGSYRLEETFNQEGGPNWTSTYSFSFSRARTHGFTRSETQETTIDITGGVTTSSSQITTTRSLAAYPSTIAITDTSAGVMDWTTTETTTRSLVTSAAGPTTTETTESITRTTSTTITFADNVIASLYVPSTTLSAPVSLVPISEVEGGTITEAWEVTATADTAGCLSDIAQTFTKRTGTRSTSSATLKLRSPGVTYSTSYEGSNTAAETLTLNTTSLVTASDTFVPFASALPATETTTREFTLLTTTSTTLTRNSWITGTAELSGYSSDHNTALVTVREMVSGVMPVTINDSPTSTKTDELHVTWETSSARAVLRNPADYAITDSSTAEEGESAQVTVTIEHTGTETYEETITSTETTVELTNEDPFSFSSSEVTLTDTTYEQLGFQVYQEPCAIPFQIDSEEQSTDNGAYTDYETRFTTHDAPADHTVSAETWRSSTGTYTDTTGYTDWTYSAPTTTTTHETIEDVTTTSSTETQTKTTAYSNGTSFTQAEGNTFTYAIRFPQVTVDASANWTAHQMHPRGGFKHPAGLSASDAVGFGLTADASLHFGVAATQDDISGPLAPKVDPAGTRYTDGSSIYTAGWKTSDSKLYFTSAVTATYTTTQRHGSASTVTHTRTTTESRTTGSIALSVYSACRWYEPKVTSDVSEASRVGGVAPRSEYAAAVYWRPGVRNSTHQTSGTASSSGTSYLTGPDQASGDGYAMPTRSETVRSVWFDETFASIIDDFGSGFSLFYPLGYTAPINAGTTSRPVITASQFPNL